MDVYHAAICSILDDFTGQSNQADWTNPLNTTYPMYLFTKINPASDVQCHVPFIGKVVGQVLA